MTSSSTPGGPASPEPTPKAAEVPTGLVPLLEPREGLPPVTDTEPALAAAVEALVGVPA